MDRPAPHTPETPPDPLTAPSATTEADLAIAEETLLAGRGAVWLPRDVVRVAGPDANSFLQGQLSQDVVTVTEGGSALSFLLQPTGKVDALVRVIRTGGDEVLLDTDAGFGGAVEGRLRKFKLRVKADVDALAGWRCLRMLGASPDTTVGRSNDGLSWKVPTGWPELPGVDHLGPDPAVPDGVEMWPLEAYEPIRIAAGVPVMGRELTERTIPAEVGIVDLAVSFTKGCYTGQELVARIDSRGGHVPRQLRRLTADPGATPPTAAAIEVGGRSVGEVTSAAWSATRRVAVALGYVHRGAADVGRVVLRWDGGEVGATVEPLRAVGEPPT